LTAVLVAAVWAMRQAMVRDLWFDEALTLLNFALLPDAGRIYFHYAIPNNQILHTMLLHGWIAFTPVALLRLLPVLTALAALILFYRLFRVRLGALVLLPVLTAFALSLPFAIYATALRGYMLSLLLVVAALGFALDFARRGDWKNGVGYFLAALLAVGTIPTNLLAFGGVALYALPVCGRDFYRRKRFWFLAAAPAVALALFYLPIWRQFLAATRLGEGWPDGMLVLATVYGSWLAGLAVFILPTLLGLMPVFGRKNCNWTFSARAGILLLPIPAALLFAVAPFPRVFFPMWPLVLLLAAGVLKTLVAWQSRCLRRWSGAAFLLALFVAVLGWGMFLRYEPLQIALSRRFGGALADDFYLPYYMRDDFQVRKLFDDYLATRPAAAPRIFMSFKSDPWALMWAGRLAGVPGDVWTFDGPRGRVAFLPDGSLVILGPDEPVASWEERFHGRLRMEMKRGRNTVYRLVRPPAA
jgi:hypothetical protein